MAYGSQTSPFGSLGSAGGSNFPAMTQSNAPQVASNAMNSGNFFNMEMLPMQGLWGMLMGRGGNPTSAGAAPYQTSAGGAPNQTISGSSGNQPSGGSAQGGQPQTANNMLGLWAPFF